MNREQKDERIKYLWGLVRRHVNNSKVLFKLNNQDDEIHGDLVDSSEETEKDDKNLTKNKFMCMSYDDAY